MKILVIRHDNIGDLIVTTPLFRALRERFPDARIDALVNSYNRPVLDHNPDLSQIHVYTKGKHREDWEWLLATYWRRMRLMLKLRFERYDTVIVANWGYHPRLLRPARWIAPKSIIGFVPKATKIPGIDCGIPINKTPRHCVEKAFSLLAPLGITGSPPPLCLVPAQAEKTRSREALASQRWFDPDRMTVAIHVSSRKATQRWPWESFAELIRRLHAKSRCQFMLFWSPGDEDNKTHPGDDQKAAAIIAATVGLPVLPYPTGRLERLIGGLAACDAMICSDGGAMHVAAGLGLPIVCFFGDSVAQNWHPWGVPYELLQPPGRNVGGISVDDAESACDRLMAKVLNAQSSP